MIPRGKPYISWTDLLAAAVHCVIPGNGDFARRRVEADWAPNTVAFLSVRSGLDALFQVLALPKGSEIILSAITIPHILDVIAHHGLVAVPVDIDLDTLSVDADDLRAAVTPRTRAIIIAHLFGSRMPLTDIAALAGEKGLLLIEDCAQANDGSSYRGLPASDVSMWSFGAIKRQTALGGGLLCFRDPALAARVRHVQSAYPTQSRRAYFQRVMTMSMVKALVTRPGFQLFVTVCKWRGLDHDTTLGTALRGFAHGDLIARLRHRPSGPLLRVFARSMKHSPIEAISQRVAIVDVVTSAFPALHRPGARAEHHTHWLFPMMAHDPPQLMRHLWNNGFDATCGASNLVCVPPPAGRAAPVNAQRLMAEILYLPLYPGAELRELHGMASVVRDHEKGPARQPSLVGAR